MHAHKEENGLRECLGLTTMMKMKKWQWLPVTADVGVVGGEDADEMLVKKMERNDEHHCW